jgi:hypothetical protein
MELISLTGGCHCGNLRTRLQLTREPPYNSLRACGCSFCRAHATRTVADTDGLFEIWADDWTQVEPYRFGSRTADYLICKRCGVYIGAVADTVQGTRAVVNVNALAAHVAFTQPPYEPDYEGETTAARAARRAANWMPTVVHR